jgi:hypothetical protein
MADTMQFVITPNETELAILNELMADFQTLSKHSTNAMIGHSLLNKGKLAEAESQYLSCIEDLKSAREQVISDGKGLIENLIRSLTQDAAHYEHPNPDTVLTLAIQIIDADISSAQEGLDEARIKREEFGDEVPAEVRYQEVKGWNRSINLRFAAITTVVSVLTFALGAWLFLILAWLIALPILLWAIVIFLYYVKWALARESLLASMDTELREFAYRDGWTILPPRPDDDSELDNR